jgi:replicative DNA helicase
VTSLANIPVEHNLVSAMLADWPSVRDAVASVESEHDFTDPRCTVLVRAIRDLDERGEAVDVLSVAAELERRGSQHLVSTYDDDAAWLGEIAAFEVSTAEQYVKALVAALKKKTAERLAAIEAADAELDEFALRDVEPYSAERLERAVIALERRTAPEKYTDYGADWTATLDRAPQPSADPWSLALDAAKTDIASALGRTTTNREPLFGDDTDAVSILACEFDGARWLVKGILEQQTLGLIGAAPKQIKTWLADEIGVAIATGTKVCGEFYAERGIVVMFCAEDTKQSKRNRIRSLLAGAGRKLEPGQLYIRWRGKTIDITSDDDMAWLLASARSIGKQIALLIIDPLRDVHGAEENSSDGMSNVMRRLRVLGELLGCAVLVNHHATKPSESTKGRKPGQQLRGSGAIYGSADTVMVFTDSKGNGIDDFTIATSCEVKGRRSAGGFGLNLRITDNAEGEAVRADWKYLPLSAAASKVDAKTEKQDHEDKVHAFVVRLASKGQHLTRTEIRGHKSRPVPYAKVIPTLDRLLEFGRLQLDDEGRIRLADSVQTEFCGAPDLHLENGVSGAA